MVDLFFKYFYQTIPFLMTIIYFYIFYCIGFLKGLISITIFFQIYDFLLLKLLKLERISAGDRTFMWNTKEQTYNLLAVLKFDKMNTDSIKNLLITNGIKKFRKFRSKLVFKFFDWWWLECSLEDSLKRIEVYEKHNFPHTIHTEEDLINYAYQELSIKFDIEKEPPFKFIIIEDNSELSEFRHLLIIKIDHCLADGVSLMNFICGVADNYTPYIFPGTMSKSISIVHKISIYFFLPFYLIYTAYRTFFVLKPVDTIFKTNREIMGAPRIALSNQIQLLEFIKMNKQFGVSFNDLMISFISKAAKNFCEFSNKLIPPHILMCFPVNLKSLPKNVEDVVITNNTTGVVDKVKLIDEIKVECGTISKCLKNTIKNIYFTITSKILTDSLWRYIPFYISKFIILSIYKKIDLTVSNVPGPKENLIYGGCKMLDIIPLFTTGFSHTFVGIISYAGNFRIAVIFDSSLNVDPKEFLNFILDEMKSMRDDINLENKKLK